jgi:DNA-binding transcriptional regulator YdaS (Cro superfamily)
MHPIDKAADIVGSQTALAAVLGVSKGAVSQWKDEDRRVPAAHCVAIERATGGAVTRRELRPDDWQQIWPELADTASN